MLIENRRDNIRAGVMIPCGLKHPASSRLDSWGVILDLSASGIQMKSYFDFVPHQKMQVSFNVKESFRFKDVEGKVVWIKKQEDYNSIGIRFASKDVRDEILSAMHYLVDSSLSKNGGRG